MNALEALKAVKALDSAIYEVRPDDWYIHIFDERKNYLAVRHDSWNNFVILSQSGRFVRSFGAISEAQIKEAKEVFETFKSKEVMI